MVSGVPPGQHETEQRLHPPLQPPGAPRQAHRATRRSRGIWLVLVALVLCGVAVVFVLPRFVSNRSTDLVAVPSTSPELPAADADAATGITERRRAEQTLQQFLHLQAALKRDNAAVWAEAAWNAALQQAREADREFGERRFEQAAREYAGALSRLQGMQASRAARLKQALAAGWRALNDNQAVQAAEQFQLALAIEATHAGAQQGLARARARPAVLQQRGIAAAAEQAGDWALARDAYQAALDLDKDDLPAATGLERVTGQIRLQTFNTAMDAALTALDGGRLAAADDALQRAAAVNPDAPSLQDARQRLSGARQQAALDSLRRAADTETRAENWQKALTLYQRALKIDANAGFARRGLEKARQRAALNRQFDHYLNDPPRLYSPEPLANAGRLLEQVKQVPADEPRLAGKLERLTALVRETRQPVQVRLRSDGETEVVIYHVGRLGRFIDQQLELRPGTYTAVGSRPGYRDVRREFRVEPGQPAALVVIRCEEPV